MRTLPLRHRSHPDVTLLSAATVVVAAAGDVGGRILDWVLDNMQEAAVWLVKGGYRALAEGGSLLLIVSGLSILAIVIPVMLLQGAVAEKSSPAGSERQDIIARRLRRTPQLRGRAVLQRTQEPTDITHDADAVARGAHEGSGLEDVRDEDDILDAVVELGLGEPWIIHLAEDVTVVRFYDCHRCGNGANAHGCGFETGFLQGAFQQLYADADVVVREVACHGIGHPSCEFEVWH